MTTALATDAQITAAQGGDNDAMWEIVTAFEPLIRQIIKDVAGGADREAVEDLLQEARAVLVQHVRDYRAGSSSAALHTYAYPALRRAVATEHLRSTTTLTVEPDMALAVRRALHEAGDDVRAAAELAATRESRHRRVTRETFHAAVEALAPVETLDTPVDAEFDPGATLADIIPDTSADFTDRAERTRLARFLLEEIPVRQSYALRAYYGIGMMTASDEEVALAIGATRPRVRGLRHAGIASARAVAVRHSITA
ncbi:sigma-70 family RNA polymerase sigma factor [Streptomyces sp. C10-9-1]|uniref:sigma-70 family RNA polymerase sigma factor n=1 Tax=Streptomyces sp. C10-9-1 TaxID=1859285 RepID=UPI0021128CC0|nr:sigma-70 family RNA polymerase sigma factor [Streptomyces sp. C10-9-1]MCQ6554744.1 sigma-70 family RNA polymerase sigma factor [Streptomyces sp. C10-9-1]